MEKDLSVVIPAYNAEKTIKKCISSVVSECESNNINYEIIVVDDGSKDSTLSILNQLSSDNSNIRVLTQKNSGPSAARNNGMKNATGKFIALNDSDDEWIPGKLKAQLTYFLENKDVSLICSQYSDTRRSENPVEITFDMEMFHNYFMTPTSIFKKEITEQVLFPENMKYSEDMRFFMMILLNNKCVYLPVKSTKSITDKNPFGESGLSSNLKKMYAGELSNLKFAYRNKKVSLVLYIKAVLYSYAKYLRRCLISKKLKRKK